MDTADEVVQWGKIQIPGRIAAETPIVAFGAPETADEFGVVEGQPGASPAHGTLEHDGVNESSDAWVGCQDDGMEQV